MKTAFLIFSGKLCKKTMISWLRPAEEVLLSSSLRRCNAGLLVFCSLWIIVKFQRRRHSFSSRIGRVKNVPRRRDASSCHILQRHQCLFGLQLQSARIFRKSARSINGGKPGRRRGGWRGGPCRPGTLSSAAKDNKHLQSSASRPVKQVQTRITAHCVNSG